ncbi:MAG: sulfotransferase [Candidatus Promineofilum sp.]|nr:sulfotransferase [Promineifilum sp.]
METRPNTAITDADLIFLVSQPRAGSTLLQSILAGSEAIHTTAEPWFMLHALYALRETGHTADYDATVAAHALQDFLGTLTDEREAYYRAVRAMAMELYGQACREANRPRFLDKTPRYYKVLPELVQVFPQAQFIVLLRNPAAVLSSILRTWVKNDWNRFDYFRDDLLSAPQLLTEFIAGSTGRVYTVQYEALVREPIETIRALCEWLALPYHPSLLDYGQHMRPKGRYGDPTGVAKHNRPSVESLNAWLEHARDPQVHHLLSAYLAALGPEQIATMGYRAAELTAQLDGVEQLPGKPSMRWEHLIRHNKPVREQLRLILAGARQGKKPIKTAKQIVRLLVGK